MKSFLIHIRRFVFRGLLAIIPILLCVAAIYFLYVFIDKKIMNVIGAFFDIRYIPGVGILLLIIFLYLIGLVTTNIIGRQLFKYLEKISRQIPFIKAVYSVGKQLSQSLLVAGDQKHSLKKAVVFKMNNVWVPAFVMGSTIHTITKEEYLSLLVSTAPTPAGFVVLVKASDVIEVGWSVEETLKMVVSMGIVCPKKIDNI